MSRVINIQDSLVFNPTAYDSSSTWSSSYTSGTSNACDSTSNTSSHARFSLRDSTNYTAIYDFEINGIPNGATITSVTGQVRAAIQNTSYTAKVQLYSGTTAKGSSTNINTSTNYQYGGSLWTVNGGTNWTLSEVSNLRLRFTPNNVSSNNNRYLYVYGANITVDYSVPGTAYTITATSNVDNVTVNPATQELMNGESATVTINGITNATDISIIDNGTDVTSQLVEHTVSGGTIEKYPGTQTTSRIQSGSSYAAYAVGRSAENPYSSSNNMYASQNSNGYAEYSFDFSDIPSGVTIDSVEVRCYGHRESSTTSSTYVAKIGLYSGSTLKSTEQEFTSTSNQTITINNPGTWTREELQNAKLRFTVGYYGGLLLGATWVVNYSVESTHYYTYTINNLNADHVIVVDDATAYVPPEEDPEYTYYPVTISSINATTDPTKGTTRVVEGSNQTITIYPDDPLVTLILDNGVDVSSQLVAYSAGSPTYTVTTQVSGASYGFNLNSSTGYYVSTNNGVSKSASVARINLDLPVRCLITIQYINYAEANYDYGMFGKVDTAVATDGLTASSSSSSPSDSVSNYQLAMASNSSSTQTITYEVESGEHFIDVKYGKDDASDSNNDSLQWKVLSIEPLEANNYYTYTLTNIQESHNLIFVFGDVTYWYINSSGSGCKLYPNGQYVVLDDDSYKLTIVPNENNATVSITDNGNNVTNSLERIESQVEKDGNTITYVNYIYRLSNISSTHNLIINCVSGSTIYMKVNNSWIAISKVYKKIDDRWQEQSDYSSLFDLTKIYVNGTN